MTPGRSKLGNVEAQVSEVELMLEMICSEVLSLIDV